MTLHYYCGKKKTFNIVSVLKQVQGHLGCRHEGQRVKNLKLWMLTIIIHLYWSAASTSKGDPDVIEAGWQSKLHFVHEVHELNIPAFPYRTHLSLDILCARDAAHKGMAETR